MGLRYVGKESASGHALSLRPAFSPLTLAASGPFPPSAISTITRSPSLRPVSPDRSRAEMWTNTSFPPPSRAMKPKPFPVLNHLTAQVASADTSENHTRRCRCGSGARVHAQHLNYVRPFMSRPDTNFNGFTRLHGVDAALSQHAPVEEGVA